MKRNQNCNSYTVCITECGNEKLNSNINLNFYGLLLFTITYFQMTLRNLSFFNWSKSLEFDSKITWKLSSSGRGLLCCTKNIIFKLCLMTFKDSHANSKSILVFHDPQEHSIIKANSKHISNLHAYTIILPSEEKSKQWPCKVKPFIPVMIPIIQFPTTKCCQQ